VKSLASGEFVLGQLLMDKKLKQTVSLAQQLALWADQLRHMSALGLHFSKNSYDLENYERIQTIAAEMFALANGQTPAEWEPLRQTVMARPTPVSVGDGAVIDENGRIPEAYRIWHGEERPYFDETR
jgi:hypothetical protein